MVGTVFYFLLAPIPSISVQVPQAYPIYSMWATILHSIGTI